MVMRERRFDRVWHPAGAWQQCERHAKKAVCQGMDKTSNNSDSKAVIKSQTHIEHKSGSKEKKHLARTELTAKIKRLACTLPVGSSILGQPDGKKNHQKPTVSEALTNTLRKNSSVQSHACPTAPGATTEKDENSNGRKRTKHANMPTLLPERKRASIAFSTCQSKTCQNMQASLLDRFAQTCTRPLPMLGQS